MQTYSNFKQRMSQKLRILGHIKVGTVTALYKSTLLKPRVT
ncbi:hypothetical protein AT1219_11130 [Vibrio alginolyticus]